MSRIAFENFGHAAQNLDDFTLIASRYKLQKGLERNIVRDLIQKLNLKSTDSVLDIGCNVGNLLIPISFFVRSVAGIDHPKCIEKLKQRFPLQENIRFFSGNFLDLNPTTLLIQT